MPNERNERERRGLPEEGDENNIDVEELIRINIADAMLDRAAFPIPEVQRFYAPAPVPAPVLLPPPRRAPAPPVRVLDLGVGRGYVPVQGQAYDLAQGRNRRGIDRGGHRGRGGPRLTNGPDGQPNQNNQNQE